MQTRVADGRARVVREVRAAAPLMADLAAPAPARGPWLTAALNVQSGGPLCRVRPRAVVVQRDPQGRPDGLALLSYRRRGATTAVTLLGAEPEAAPLPDGRPAARLYARDDEVARLLAEGVADLLDRLRGPWTLRLAGLPLGDPIVAHLAALMPDSSLATSRSRLLVDELDAVGTVLRTRDPAQVERRLPDLLARVPAGRRAAVRAVVRLHAAIGEVELAVVPGGGGPVAVLLTLLDQGPAGEQRWPWWGVSDVGGLRRELGSPSVGLTAAAGLSRLGRSGSARDLSRGTAAG
ncbi:hypothetical protein [uncultured Modestobacter sp.]|uniref:hypothetical protein n=1 Tax=uncultured Modestobacter sp. TaxID=380048 RepID=UPI00261FBF92|nr:hypothetical protein [uncultured Modestobacter sp.]